MKKNGFAALLGILLTSLVLRPPVAAVGPLVGQIQYALGLSPVQVELLTSTPVFCFGLGAFLSPMIVRRFGLDRSLLVLQALIAVAIVARIWFGFVGLLIGTAVIGLAIAVANVLLPGIVRERFPKRIPLITASYTMTLAVSASFAASTAVPFAQGLGGWALALQVWAVPAIAAFLVWSTQLRGIAKHAPTPAEHHVIEIRAVRKSPITWAIFGFFGIQSLGFYVILAWLPSLLIDRGLSPAAAGAVLGLTTIAGVPFGMLLASNLGRFKSLSVPAVIASATTLVGVLMLFSDLPVVAGVIIGLGQASTFPISLNMISTRATTTAQTTELSTISQGYGYLLAAAGTFVFGWLRESTGGWTVAIWVIAVLSAIQLVAGFEAGRNRKIDNPAA
jgi:CP family cyanate transporter-like MFS transporter